MVVVDRIVGDIDWLVLVIIKRFFFAVVAVVVNDFDDEADRLLELVFVLVVVVRFGDDGCEDSSLIVAVVGVKTGNDVTDEGVAKDNKGDEFVLLFIVKNDDEAGVVVTDDVAILLIIKRVVGLVTVGFVLVVVVVTIEFVWVENVDGVELSDDDKISEIEFARSLIKKKKRKTQTNHWFIKPIITDGCWVASGKNWLNSCKRSSWLVNNRATWA